MGKITKADIVNAIYGRTSMECFEVRNLLDLFFEEIKKNLASCSTIELRGFGTFEVKIRRGRENARNPKTGESLSVAPHGIVSFRAGKKLRQDVWGIKSKAEETEKQRAENEEGV